MNTNHQCDQVNGDSGLDPEETARAVAVAEALAKPMFCLSLLFLVLLAGLVVAWVDVLPDAASQDLVASDDQRISVSENFFHQPALRIGYLLLWTMLAIWPIFLIEQVYVRWSVRGIPNSNRFSSRFAWFSVACPPLRMGKSIPAKNGEIWLPALGWRAPGKILHKELERIFSKPMLLIAMMILPVLLIEFRFQELLQSNVWLKLLLSVSMGLIWCAFAIEFILMVSTTKKKITYVKKNWIDLAIILLPLVSFLRSLRIVRAARVAKLTKMGRIYRMRGLFAKTIRAFLVLELIHRIFKFSPEKRLDKLLAQVEEKEEELRELQAQVKTVRAEIEAQKLAEELEGDDSPSSHDNFSVTSKS